MDKETPDNVTYAALGETCEVQGNTYEVAAKCDQDLGNWWCVTHQEGFLNPMQSGDHIEKGKHLMTWVCHVHGVEVP